jgi:T4 RnlA family RNA ligase
MHYQFPIIEHLDDVRPAIAGRDEFIIAEREWGYVVNYMVAMSDTFPPVLDEEYWCPGCNKLISEAVACSSQRCPEPVSLAAIRRECRGLLFHKDGSIMSRRLHKFFNVNERDETQFVVINFHKPHVILEKLDGSMITPVATDAGLRWGTKMGITDVAMGAEEFVAKHPKYADFARGMIGRGFTPIFEWCSRKQRIVVDYPEDRLVLIAVRNTVTGEYTSYEKLLEYNNYHGIAVVKSYKGTAENMKALMDETKDAEGIEGWIIRFDDGHMLKAKGEWYVRLHKTKDSLSHEKNVIDLLLSEKMDDAKSFMLDEDRKRVEEFETEFWQGVADSVNNYETYFQMVLAAELDRKRYALEWMPTVKDNDGFAPIYVFARFNNKDPRELVVDQIRKNIGTQAKVDSVRDLFGNAHWSNNYAND